MERIKIVLPPLKEKDVRKLCAGERVLITGTIYSARDAAHKRLMETIREGGRLPFDPEGQIIYYVGPTPSRPGRVIGSAGPTTSSRMDPYTPALLKLGLRGMIGKGTRSREVIEAMKEFGAVYLIATGGAGALLARSIRHSEIIAYPELGPEAVRRLSVVDFPAVVGIDAFGRNLYER